MTDVLARLAPGRALGASDFADITSVRCVSVDFAPGGLLRVRFDGALTTQQVWRVKVRVQSETKAEEDARVAILAARDEAALATATLADVKALALLLAKRELGE